VNVPSTATSAGLSAEARRLVEAGLLAREALEALDFEGLAAFWQTDLGQRIRSRPERIRREFPFTARFSPAELAQLTGRQDPPQGLEGEFVIVQGVADLVLVEPEGLTIVDFKTDRVTRATLQEKVRAYTPQLALYARALERTLHQPVHRAGLFFIDVRELVDVPVQLGLAGGSRES
jgi:ATP-dependent helicase/nuclease subunit A